MGIRSSSSSRHGGSVGPKKRPILRPSSADCTSTARSCRRFRLRGSWNEFEGSPCRSRVRHNGASSRNSWLKGRFRTRRSRSGTAKQEGRSCPSAWGQSTEFARPQGGLAQLAGAGRELRHVESFSEFADLSSPLSDLYVTMPCWRS